MTAMQAGLERVIVPASNVAEARLAGALHVIGARSLRECMAVLSGTTPPDEPDSPPLHEEAGGSDRRRSRLETADLADVRGQAQARWCVEVSAAGGHHLFLEGPPGAGKTMLAERLAPLLPDLDVVQSIEVSKIHSVAGLLSRDEPRVVRPPFLAPNHTDTVASVVGGGARLIKPGAISLAHLGVLFLDETMEAKFIRTRLSSHIPSERTPNPPGSSRTMLGPVRLGLYGADPLMRVHCQPKRLTGPW
ncbi:MAG: ATP-binding protein [Propionibacteriales bacterium]|nr:ATP-binding protein [Propionibacteriales bacterium]